MAVDAFYYPNICQLWKVRLADGAKVLATTDAGGLTHDRRHFVDCRLIRSLPNGKELMAGLLPADPACTRVTGQKATIEFWGCLRSRLSSRLNCP
jgi:hypothetical protein